MFDNHQFQIKAILIPLLLVAILAVVRWQYGLLLFHSLAEMFSVMVGVLMLVIVWNTQRFTQNHFLLFLGIGYFWIAVLDSWHTITFKGMPFFQLEGSEVGLHFWIYTRFIEAFVILLAPIFLKRQLNATFMFSAGALLTLLVTWASFSLTQPVMLTASGLTLFKIASEFVIVGIFTLSIFVYYKKKELLPYKTFNYLVGSILLTILAELSFTLYTDIQGLPMVTGHLFKFLSFWLIYQAIVKTTLIEPFTMLAQTANSYDAIPSAAIVLDHRGTILQVNRSAQVLSGMSSQQLIGNNVHQYFHPLDNSSDDCEFCTAIASGAKILGEVTEFSESKKWFMLSLAPIQNKGDSSEIVEMVQSLVDITYSRQFVSSLVKTEKRYRNLFENSEISIWNEDLSKIYKTLKQYRNDGIKDLEEFLNKKPEIVDELAAMVKVMHVNQATLKLFSVETESDFLEHIPRSFGEGAREVFIEELLAIWELKSSFRSEVTFRAQNDEIINGIISFNIPKTEDGFKSVAVTIVDITKSKQAQAALEQSENRFRKLFERTESISVQGYDREHKVIYWNPASESLYGFSESEAMGQKLEDLIIPEDMSSQVEEGVTNWLNGGKSIPSQELILQDSEGNPVPVFSNHVMLRDRDNNPEMYCIDIDLTKIKQAQQELRQNEQQLRSLIQAMPDLVWMKDPNGIYLTCNPRFEQFFGAIQSEIVGKTDYDFVDKKIADSYRLHDKISMDSGKPSRNEETIIYAEGGHKELVETIKTPLYSNDGELIGILGIARDITERNKAQGLIKQSEERLDLALSVTNDGIWDWDMETDEIIFDERYYTMAGYNPDDFPHNFAEWEKRVHPDDIEDASKIIDEYLKGKRELYLLEFRFLTKSGDYIWIQGRGKIVERNKSGKPLRFVGTHTDINKRKLSEKALVESESWFKAITNQSTEGITVADLNGNYTFVNTAFCNMIGYSEEELLQMSVFDIKAPEQGHSFFDRSKSSTEETVIEAFLQRKDSSIFISEMRGKKIEINDQIHVLGTVRDTTEQVQAVEQIRILSQAIEQSPVSVVMTDVQGNIEYVNSMFESVTGYSVSEVIGKNPRILNSGKTHSCLYKEMWTALTQGKSWEGELQNTRKNGEIFWEHAHLSPVIDESGITRHYLAVKEDITFRKQQEELILHQAHFDSLTELPNRFLSLNRLGQIINEAKRNNELVAVLFLDLDDFKKINDTLGHEVGDKLLIEAAERLQKVVRTVDTVGRLGGDEFIVLLDRLSNASDARNIAENILNSFRDSFEIDGRNLMLTISIGIAVFPGDGENASELLRNADTAMYHSKDLGRNTYSYFTDAMNRDVSRRLELEEQIHSAISKNEFTVFYQPKINISDGEIMGAEALLRWNNPVLGAVSPIEFIPIAEQTGLIIELGQFVLTEALKMTAKWQKEFNSKFCMAVNVSPNQFRDPELIHFIEQALINSGVTSDTLELEITEGVLMSGHTYIEEALSRLNQIGVSIAMDDFGTGYSSLSYLRSYPFNVLKIDQSFINDIAIDSADRELINASIAMAHGLNLKVVAEGVETQQQLDFLKNLDCDYAQGYLFSRPVPADKFSQILEKFERK